MVIQMADLIDRQQAIDAIANTIVRGESLGMCIAEDILHDVPSEDVQPVRHGHWIHDGLDTPHGVDWMHCSECGNRDVYCPAAMTDYCPNCGARMDEHDRLNQ